MAEVTAALVKELREQTGAGMMDCKKALTETGGDLEAAIDWLRKKGLAAAAKKAGRVTAEGLVGGRVDGHQGGHGRGQLRDRLRRAQRGLPGAGRARSRRWRSRPAATSRRCRRRPSPATGAERRRRDHPGDRRDRREHQPAPDRRGRGRQRAVVGTYVHAALAPGLGKIGVLVGAGVGRRPGALAASASSSPCTSPRPTRMRSASTVCDPAVVERERGDLRRAGARQRQAGGDHRQDGRRPDAQVLRGERCCSSRPS